MAITVNGAAGATTINQLTVGSSADLASIISDESGTGVLAFTNTPTLVTPILGTPTSVTLTNATGLPVSGITASTATALGVGSIELGDATDTTIARSSAGVVTIEGSAVLVSGGALGTPSSATLTSATGLPIATGVSGLGSNIATLLTTPSSANLASAITDETGSGALVFGTSPTIATPAIDGGTLINSVIRGIEEDVEINATAATGTLNIDVNTASVHFFTTAASANFTLNFRFSSSVSLNTSLATGDAITIVVLNTNGATARFPNVIQIDGTTVTPKVPAAITAGNASSIDAYSFTIIKTASATFTVLETQTKFA